MHPGGNTYASTGLGLGATQLYGAGFGIGSSASQCDPFIGCSPEASMWQQSLYGQSCFAAAAKGQSHLIIPQPLQISKIHLESAPVRSVTQLAQTKSDVASHASAGDVRDVKTLHEAWVESRFKANSDVPQHLQKVRNDGIRTNADIEKALDYLSFIDPRLTKVVDVIRQRRREGLLEISVKRFAKKGEGGSAQSSFSGRVNRSSDGFGTKISVSTGRGPDTLLHEIVHTLPLSYVRELFSDHVLPALPPIDPSNPFSDLRSAILEHMRVNEVMSFGSECLLYDLESRHGVSHVFNEEMLRMLYGAWQQQKLDGIHKVFSSYMSNYELREGINASLLALVVKVEGRADLSWEEYEKLLSDNNGPAGLLENHLKRYVTERGLDVPADFFSPVEVIRRSGLSPADVSTDALVNVIQSCFDAIDHFESLAEPTEMPSIAQSELSLDQIPSQGTHADRKRVYAAYANVVDRVLDDPPASLSREEVAALVSFVRTVPAQAGLDLSRRLRVYIGKGMNDLGVTLGLILHEKGLHDEGKNLVMEYMDMRVLPQVLPTLLKIMGQDALIDVIEKEETEFAQMQTERADAFRIWAMDQFLVDEGSEMQRDLNALFLCPEILEELGWKDLGPWLIEHPADLDYTVAYDDHLLNLGSCSSLGFGRSLASLIQREGELLSVLQHLRQNSSIKGSARASAERAWQRVNSIRQGALDALGRIIASSDDHVQKLDIGKHVKGMDVYTASEIEEAFASFPDAVKRRIVAESQLNSDEWWQYPETVKSILEGHLAVIKDAKISVSSLFDAKSREKTELKEALGNFREYMVACLNKRRKRGELPLDELSQAIPGLIDGLIQTIDWNSNDLVFFGEDIRAPSSVFADIAESIIPYSIGEIPVDQVIRMVWTFMRADFNPNKSPESLEKLETEIRRAFDSCKGKDDDAIRPALDLGIIPAALQLMVWANEIGYVDAVERMHQFIFHEIPSNFPTDREYRGTYGEVSTWGKRQNFHIHMGELVWSTKLEIERTRAKRDDEKDALLSRVRAELERGGSNISIKILGHFANSFAQEGDNDRVKQSLRLMMQKSFLTLGIRGLRSASDDIKQATAVVRKTFESIQSAPISDPEKDDMLYDYVDRLLGFAGSFRGVNIELLSEIRGLFPWRTPFIRAGDIPNYPKTETLVIKKLAQIPELVDEGKAKNDRVRLGAFAGASLPLQRYPEWLERLFADEGAMPELAGLGIRRDFGKVLARLDLPHPYDIPAELASSDVDALLTNKGANIQAILNGENRQDQDVVVRVLPRYLGSELRYIKKAHPSIDHFSQSKTAAFLMDWLKAQYQGSERSLAVSKVLDVLFEAGPIGIRRLDAARDLFDQTISRNERQAIFDRATSHLVYSKRVRKQLAELRAGSDEQAEKDYMDLLFSIQYHRHSGGMVSNFFLEQMEKNEELRQAYQQYTQEDVGADAYQGFITRERVQYHDGESEDMEQQAWFPLIIAECGNAGSGSSVVRGVDALRSDMVDRMNFYIDALKFLRKYVQTSGTEHIGYADSMGFYFNARTIEQNSDLKSMLEAHIDDYGMLEYDRNLMMDVSLQSIKDVLGEANWDVHVSKVLDDIHGKLLVESVQRGEANELDQLQRDIDREIARLETYSDDIAAAYQRDLVQEAELPDFIMKRKDLEQNVLISIFTALDPAQRNLLRQNLEKAVSDKERLLLIGQAAHLEKALQLASVHPSVPDDLQELFSVFQDEVPHRDEIDAQHTLNMHLTGDDRERLDLNLSRPIKEGTIGGVYEGTYEGDPIVLKLRPDGKSRDIDDSLRIVAAVRKGLAQSKFKDKGARALDDFLAFYQRVMIEELDLHQEIENARTMDDLFSSADLSNDIVVPEYLDDLASPSTVAMKPLPSRHLRTLSDAEREEVFANLDSRLIPAMILRGLIHFDLHPGNIGVTDDGRVALYDMGRVHKLTKDERASLFTFNAAVKGRQIHPIKVALSKLGHVWDKQAFENIDGLLQELVDAEDPMKAVEEIYPRLPDYGFRLDDSYVKLLLMHVTWEGTKDSFRRNGSDS